MLDYLPELASTRTHIQTHYIKCLSLPEIKTA